MNDAELLRRFAREGDQDAFAELVRRHAGLVYAAARRQTGGNVHLAQDVTQAVFITLAKKAASAAKQRVLVAWLYRCTRLAALQARRNEARRVAREDAAARAAELDTAVVGEAEWTEVEPVLDEAMERLSERDREAVLLRFFAGRTFAEIGAALGVGENAARMRTERALEKLRGALARRGVTSSATALGGALATHAAPIAPPGVIAAVLAACGSAGVVGGAGAGAMFFLINATKYAGVAVAGLVIGGVAVGLWPRPSDEASMGEKAPEARVVAKHENVPASADLARLEQENRELREALAAERARAQQARASASRDRERLAELRRPMEIDMISSTLKARLKPGETVVTGGSLMPSGLRLFVFGRPEQQVHKGQAAVAFEVKYAALSDEAAREVGLEALMTNAANTLQHAEVWAPGEMEAVLARLTELARAKKGVDVLNAAKVTLLSGNEASMHSGEEFSMNVKPTVQTDGALDLELRTELAVPPEASDKQEPAEKTGR